MNHRRFRVSIVALALGASPAAVPTTVPGAMLRVLSAAYAGVSAPTPSRGFSVRFR